MPTPTATDAPDTSSTAATTGTPPAPSASAPAQSAPPSDSGQSQVNPTTASSSATIPTQADQPAPRVLVPVKPQGLAGVIAGIRNVLSGGGSQPDIYIDPETGHRYVNQTPMSGKAQWLKIGGEALRGAAAGLAAGKGAGNEGRAAAAGINAGDQQRQQAEQSAEKNAEGDYERQRQIKLDNANDQINTAKLVAAQLAATRLRQTTTQDMITNAQTNEKFLKDSGARLVGVARNLDDIIGIQKNDEQDLLKNHYGQNLYVTVPQYDNDGKAAGISIYAKGPGWGDQLVAPKTQIPIWKAPDKPGEQPTRQMVTPTKPMTNDQLMGYNNAYSASQAAWDKQQAENYARRKQGDEAGAKVSETPSVIRKNDAEAAAAAARAANVKDGKNPDGTLTPEGQQTLDTVAEAMIHGDIMPHDFASFSKAKGLNKNEVLARAVTLAKQRGETFSEPILQQEAKFAESPKTQALLDGIDRMVGTSTQEGQLDMTINLARKIGLNGSAPYNVVVQALKRFHGDTAAKNYQTMISETRRSIGGLIGNPLLGGGETDKKLEQADSVLGSNPTMDNLVAANGILKQALGTQRTAMLSHNRYLRARYGSGGSQPPQQQAANVATSNGAPPAAGGFNWGNHPVAQ